MSYILHIATAVPEFKIGKEDLVNFYANAVNASEPERFKKKLNFISDKTKIRTRYSCIPDYKGNSRELFINGNYRQPVEKRMEVYKNKIVPLASDAINKLFAESEVTPDKITHLITVTCTGLFAPGLEFLISQQYGIEHVEKIALNFLGCYAAIKALKHAHYIAQANPEACILIVSAELCSLHFYPSEADEDIVSNLLFADGAAAVLVCGNKNKLAENKKVLQLDAIGSAFIPDTAHLMTWELSASAFKMYLSSAVVDAIKENIQAAVNAFLGADHGQTDYWAIHPGGVKIVEAVQTSLHLNEGHIAHAMEVLKNYGNMSSPTVLFILKSIFDEIKKSEDPESKKIVSCAFGPGLNVELLSLSSQDTGTPLILNHSHHGHAVEN